MKKVVLFLLLVSFVFMGSGSIFAEVYEKVSIKHGMYEENVNKEFGDPVLVEDIKPGFWPIPKKKALYKIGDADFMILNFFSGRVSEITILSDVDREEAVEMFEYQLGLAQRK